MRRHENDVNLPIWQSCLTKNCFFYLDTPCRVPLDYEGAYSDRYRTKDGHFCKPWKVNPLKNMFTYLNRGEKNNYCRNPALHPGWPWCFVLGKWDMRNITCELESCTGYGKFTVEDLTC